MLGQVGSLGLRARAEGKTVLMITVGIILLIVGILVGVPLLTTLGIILAVVGALLVLVGSLGHSLGGRRHYW
jgi:uncharacterized membrane protein HdeD (DUF308 family)